MKTILKINKGILIIIQNLSFPLDRRVWREACYLKENGFNVFIISPTGKNQDKKLFETIDEINIFRFPLITDIGGKYYYFIEYLWSFIAIFFLFLFLLPKVKYIQVCNPPDIFFSLGWICQFFNKKFIFDHHDLCPELFMTKFKMSNKRSILLNLLIFFEGLTVKTSKNIISVNENYKQILHKRHNIPLEKIVVSRNIPNPTTFKIVSPNKSLKRTKEFLITYHGVFGEQDSVEIVIYAINELVNLGINNIHVALIGDGPMQKSLKELVRKHSLESYFTFTGYLNSEVLLEYLSTATIGLTPDIKTPYNNLSSMNKTIEYLTIGLPFIAFDLKETMDTAGNAALYATNNDYKDFANKIKMLLEDEVLRNKLKENAKERMKMLNYEEQMNNYLRVFKNEI